MAGRARGGSEAAADLAMKGAAEDAEGWRATSGDEIADGHGVSKRDHEPAVRGPVTSACDLCHRCHDTRGGSVGGGGRARRVSLQDLEPSENAR